MSKRKPKEQRKLSFKGKLPWSRRPAVDLPQVFNQADRLMVQGRAQEAVTLLEPLLDSYPRVADLHYYLGYARLKAGDPWGALAGYERARELSGDPSYWLPLASLYLELELNAHALHAFRQVLKQQRDLPMLEQVRETVASLEQEVQALAGQLNLPAAQVEKGLYHLDSGQRALRQGDYPACIAANRQAIKLLPDWPPPYNNLSLALFFDGQPEEAIKVSHQVLAKNPQNVQALGNAIRYLTWTGQEAEARALWAQLQAISPQDESERLKMAEAAAILAEDEHVYQLLKPLDRSDKALMKPAGFVHQAQYLLAVAEANSGRRAARGRLEAIQTEIPWAKDLLAALKAKQPGPGWADRFPYFHSTELITKQGMEEFVKLVGRREKLPPQQFRRQMERFVTRFPQIIRVAEKLIWEENQPTVGIQMLATIATPAAYAALRRFGLSQAGDDETRMQALFNLLQAGQIAQDETLRVWSQGEWREVQLRQYEISDEPRARLNPAIANLMEKALNAFKRNDDQRAERLFRQVLEMDPRTKEVYNNLAALYSRRGEMERAKEMLQQALEIDPTYVFPRCNLALFLLNDNDFEGAEAMLKPLAEVYQFHPQEMAFYSYLQARLAIHREEYDAARKALEAALQLVPDYEPAKSLLERLDSFPMLDVFKSLADRAREQNRASRARLQSRLITSEPALAEAISIYSKDILTGMARVVLPRGGWSGLRKAELVQHLVEALSRPDSLRQIVNTLQAEERSALRQVMAGGGSIPWSDFEARYGNDLEESPYWNWHEPKTAMGRLRQRGLLVEASVAGERLIVVPSELRPILSDLLLA